MRASSFLLATLKETPSDAEIVSHRLMLRAGMVRRVAAGIYNWLPLGMRVLRRIEAIVREEMDAAGAQEILMPAVQPAELWRASGRWEDYGPELLRFSDRHQREFCMGPTHEEVVAAIAKNEIRSYRQLPVNLYQIQTKFRDEIRPRFGVMRGREFIMKDAYSFDLDPEGMERAYEVMRVAYVKIFERLGLDARAVRADSGAIGGSYSHEFHVLADSGEDSIALCDEIGFAANVETIDLAPPATPRPGATRAMRVVDTPGCHTIEEVGRLLGVDAAHNLKTLVVEGDDEPLALIVRGDHELNALKAERVDGVKTPLRMASRQSIERFCGAGPGSLGPVGLKIRAVVDHAAARLADFTCGANRDGKHLTGVNWGRDAPEPETADLRRAVDGDPCPDAPQRLLSVRRGIEVGHIFQLGTKYSESLEALVRDDRGRARPMYMGCYGIGVTRVAAAAIEQNHDAAGIVWPDSIAPFDLCIAPIGYGKSDAVREAANRVYRELLGAGFEALLDDRDERPGVMFAEMDLIGIPHRLVIGARGLENGAVEYRRRGDEEARELPLDNLPGRLKDLVRRA